MKISEAQAVLRLAKKQYGNADLYLGTVFAEARPVSGVCVTPHGDTREAGVLLWVQQDSPPPAPQQEA